MSSWMPGWLMCGPPPEVEKEALPDQVVKLVVTPIGPRLPQTVQAYHSSILVGDIELFFGILGIGTAHGPQSHSQLPRSDETQITSVGKARAVDAASLRKKLLPYFRKDTYDLLRKNCNTFSDVCLRTLVDMRLDAKYRYLEEVGLSMEHRLGLMSRGGGYLPNPLAEAFAPEAVVAELRGLKIPRAQPALSGTVATPLFEDDCLLIEGKVVAC